MDIIEELKEAGFSGFKTIGELMDESSCIPSQKGIYMVLRQTTDAPSFLPVGTGGHFKGENPNVSIQELESNWIEDEQIVYIGKAGGLGKKATLNSRLKQYLKFGQGYNIGHKGGRYIWQLRDSKDLLLCWKVLPTEEPRECEHEEIIKFKAAHNGIRPFANLID